MENLRGDTEYHLAHELVSAAGLMQLGSATATAHAADTVGTTPDASDRTRAVDHNDSHTSTTSAVSATGNAPLPLGWHRIAHGSGLPCYVHDRTGAVSWTRPYTLDVGGRGVLSQSELHRLVQQHVPPLGLFAPASAVAAPRQTKMSVAAYSAASSIVTHDEGTAHQSKKRKLDAAITEQNGSDTQSSMTLDEFKLLSIDDPRVLQACLELSVKTPAQVLQEYQNRNRGVSINYNAVPVEDNGVKLFKTIVSAGGKVAEGVASTKKTSKQLGAQQLLAILHERTARRYHQVAEMYKSSLKGQPAVTEPSTYGQATSSEQKSGRRNGDPRYRPGNGTSNLVQYARRPSPNQENAANGVNRNFEMIRRGTVPSHCGPSDQQVVQHARYQGGLTVGGGWQEDAGVDDAGPERVVVYLTTPAESARTYGDGQHYRNVQDDAHASGSYPSTSHFSHPNVPGVYAQQYGSSYRDVQSLAGNRSCGSVRTLDHSNPSIDRAAVNLRTQRHTSPSEM
ncbi:unnamed protein product [Hyaloperonospora brassicae]|uniref:WW domain-containing protein n=1 Tax=Hyaloperonospora brassicae TaxID=162125 RepID=A0AAV0TGX2_HYABA|nr:unnamed protein product [Hyaloperonospora brassicae]